LKTKSIDSAIVIMVKHWSSPAFNFVYLYSSFSLQHSIRIGGEGCGAAFAVSMPSSPSSAKSAQKAIL